MKLLGLINRNIIKEIIQVYHKINSNDPENN